MAKDETMAMIGKLPEFDAKQFKRKSKDEIWASRGLGMAATAVDGWMEMFSAFLTKLGCDVGPLELERWMDTYYQLRYEAEKEADLAKFIASSGKVEAKLEPIVPKTKPKTSAAETSGRGEFRLDDPLFTLLLLAFLFGGPFPRFANCGPEIKDPDEEEDKPKACCHGKEYCECKGPNGESNR